MKKNVSIVAWILSLATCPLTACAFVLSPALQKIALLKNSAALAPSGGIHYGGDGGSTSSNIRWSASHTMQQQQSSLSSLFSQASGSATVQEPTFSGIKQIGTVTILLPSIQSKNSEVLSKFGAKSPVDNPTMTEAAMHLANKLLWFADGGVTASVVTMDKIQQQQDDYRDLLEVDALIALGLSSDDDMAKASSIFDQRRQRNADKKARQCQWGLDCSGALPIFVGPYDELSVPLPASLPWTNEASGGRLLELMRGLFDRWNSDDFAVAMMLFFNQCSGTPVPWVQHSIDSSWEKGPVRNAQEFYSMVTQCGDCITKCLADENCKTCLDALNAVDTRDQVASYRTIVSFESDILKDFSYCILQKNNIFGCSAQVPKLPEVQPMTSWRGAELTTEAARSILVGHLKDEAAPEGSTGLDISWKVACGANVAYDQFPSQNQIFYESANGRDLWYDPVFRVETIDGRNVWCKRHYKVRNGPVPGTFRFSVLDNGVTSNEFWTIAGAADDLSWIVFHYAGAATAVGQRYLGGLLCTPDGALPADKELPAIWTALKSAGIQPWELYVVDNDTMSAGAIEAGAAPLNYFRDDVLAAKAKKAGM